MNDLIKKYNSECEIVSKLSDKIWKYSQIGIYFFTVFIFYYFMFQKKYLLAFILSFGFSILFSCVIFYVCMHINDFVIARNLNFVNIARKNNINRDTLYKKLDLYQKNWIIDYCKSNNIDSIDKIKILREELKEKIQKTNKKVKLIDYPTIISSIISNFIFTGFTSTYSYFNLLLFTIIALTYVYLLKFSIKQFQDFSNNESYFNKYLGYDRLSELLLYCILKSNK